MTIFEWAAIGGVVLALFIFCARIMRRGLSTLDDVRAQHAEKIGDGKKRLAEDNRKIPAEEHFHLLEAAINDLIRLSPDSGEWAIRQKAHIIELTGKTSSCEIELVMKEIRLRTNARSIHGKPHWLFRANECVKIYYDIAQLMAKINQFLQENPEIEAIPAHLARRLAGTRAGLDLLHTNGTQIKDWKNQNI